MRRLPDKPLLLQVLREPDAVRALDLRGWDLLVRQARNAQLLGTLDARLAGAGLLEEVPASALAHLASRRVVARHQDRLVNTEFAALERALAGLDGPLVLLKGAAYKARRLRCAAGRMMSDIDLLIPAAQLPAAETSLFLHGWVTTASDRYDDRYYRQWMHELPPLRHIRRNAVLDVHHTILPRTARNRLDPGLLFDAAEPVAGTRFHTLSCPDMVLHSAAHLFHDGELDHGLRDLVDLDGLLREFDAPPFWDALAARAAALDLGGELYLALRYCADLLQTPIPAGLRAAVASHAPRGPSRAVLHQAFRRALLPAHPSCADAWTPLARRFLYLRAHYLRMPLRLLIPHLARKAWKQAELDKIEI